MKQFLELLKELGPKINVALPLIMQLIAIFSGTSLDGLMRELEAKEANEGFSAGPQVAEAVSVAEQAGCDEETCKKVKALACHVAEHDPDCECDEDEE